MNPLKSSAEPLPQPRQPSCQISQAFIIVVDDTPINIILAKSALPDCWDVLGASSAAKMFKFMKARRPDLILMDIQMPQMGGLEALSILRSDPESRDIPVILFSSGDDCQKISDGIALGAVDYIGKPFAQALFRRTVEIHLAAEKLGRRLKSQNELVEKNQKELASLKTDFESIVVEGCKQAMARRDALLDTVSNLVDYRIDSGSNRQGDGNSLAVLESMIRALKDRGVYRDQIQDWDLDVILRSARLHDVGKLALSGEILAKPGKLTRSEYEQVKRHPTLGARIVANMEAIALEHDILKYAKVLAETHQERWDGTGYPHGLSGEGIPLPGRLMAINSVYKALTTERPWKQAKSHEEAVQIILAGKGRQFDPTLVDVFAQVAVEMQPVAA